MQTQVTQRVRITFGIADPLNYASVLDLGRLWERLMRRARLPLAHTQGFKPHPRLQFAAALPVGYTSACELLDVLLAEELASDALHTALERQTPPGLSILHVEPVDLHAPSPQATMHAAHYRVDLAAPRSVDQVRAALSALLARDAIPRERIRKGELRPYDLRPLILAIELLTSDEQRHTLHMDLRCGQEGSGRPEEIVDALELDATDTAIHRTRLIWGDNTEA